MNFQNQITWGNLNSVDVLGGVPDIPPLVKDTLKSHIMFRCGLLYPLYSEPTTMRDAITHWFDYMAYDISKMLELAQIEYAPLENYDRIENEKIWKHEVDKRTIADTGKISDEGGSTTEDTVSAFNSSNYEPDRHQEITNGNERTLDTSRSDDNTLQHNERNERRTHGNIGTVSSQEMFNQELDLLERFNPYDWIVDRLSADLFLGIW